MKVKLTAAILALLLLITATACAGQGQPGPDGGAQGENGSSTEFISFASYSSGSYQYMYVAALAGLLREHAPHLNLTNEATSGTSENLDLLYRGEVGLSLASPERLYYAHHGEDAYQENGPLNCGVMWSYMQQATLLFVKENSGITGFGDLAGKKVCIGGAGSSNEIKNAFILEAYGYTRKAPDSFEFLELQTFSIDYGEGANALSEGTVDAIIATQPLPEPAIYELALVTPLTVFPLDADRYDAIRQVYPWMWETNIPAEVYPDQSAMQSLGDPNYVVASLDLLSEEDAYTITKAYVEEILPQLAEQFDPVKPYVADPSLLTASWVIPGHPGAVRYFEEIGMDVAVAQPN